jgi:3'5'-cyclic nucleotide phosphodiesterase
MHCCTLSLSYYESWLSEVAVLHVLVACIILITQLSSVSCLIALVLCMRRNYSSSVHINAFLIGSGVQDRLHFLEMLLHCCDLSGQVMNTDIAVEWGKRIMREFCNQVSAHLLLCELLLHV